MRGLLWLTVVYAAVGWASERDNGQGARASDYRGSGLGQSLEGQDWSDNAAVVSIINHGSSRNKEAMHLARCLAFITARFEFKLVASVQKING